MRRSMPRSACTPAKRLCTSCTSSRAGRVAVASVMRDSWKAAAGRRGAPPRRGSERVLLVVLLVDFHPGLAADDHADARALGDRHLVIALDPHVHAVGQLLAVQQHL